MLKISSRMVGSDVYYKGPIRSNRNFFVCLVSSAILQQSLEGVCGILESDRAGYKPWLVGWEVGGEACLDIQEGMFLFP